MKIGASLWLAVLMLGVVAVFFPNPTNIVVSTGEKSPASAHNVGPDSSTNVDDGLIQIKAMRLSGGKDQAKLVLDLSAQAQITHSAVLDPDRLVINVAGAMLGSDARKNVGRAEFAKIYAIKANEPGAVQLEIGLDRPAQITNILSLPAFQDLPSRLVVDIATTSKALFVARARQTQRNEPAELPDVEGATSQTPDTSPAQPQPKDFKRLIVIDPGHGGADSGAVGPQGLLEKHVVFSFALELERQLAATGRYDVALTRTDDSFLSLEQRLSVARQNKADLFISIHADSFSDANVQGASVYYLDEDATDVLDKVLAENENRVDLLHGVDTNKDNAQVVDILVDLMRRATKRQSFQAANLVADGLKQFVRVRKFPVRGGDFFVLKAPEVPSILLELGFMSNLNDVQNFNSDLWRERAIVGIVRSIGLYFDQLDVARTSAPLLEADSE